MSDIIYNNITLNKSKPRRKIVVPKKMQQEVAQYIRDTLNIIRTNPEIKEIKGLKSMLTNSIQSMQIQNVENHANKVLDMTARTGIHIKKVVLRKS